MEKKEALKGIKELGVSWNGGTLQRLCDFIVALHLEEKKEKNEDKWEIFSFRFKEDKDIIYKITETGKYLKVCSGLQSDYWAFALDEMLRGSRSVQDGVYEIYQVRRKSDQEVFTIGNKVDYKNETFRNEIFTKYCEIMYFTLMDNQIYINMHNKNTEEKEYNANIDNWVNLKEEQQEQKKEEKRNWQILEFERGTYDDCTMCNIDDAIKKEEPEKQKNSIILEIEKKISEMAMSNLYANPSLLILGKNKLKEFEDFYERVYRSYPKVADIKTFLFMNYALKIITDPNNAETIEIYCQSRS